MNIFALDADPRLAAQYHVDAHVSKMLVEYAQLMSTAHHVLDSPLKSDCYKISYKNHPSAKWARASHANYQWLHTLWVCLHEEFMHRRSKSHKSFTDLALVLSHNPLPPDTKLMPVFLAMPEPLKSTQCKTFADSVDCYRQYYTQHKRHLHVWTKRKAPSWVTH